MIRRGCRRGRGLSRECRGDVAQKLLELQLEFENLDKIKNMCKLEVVVLQINNGNRG